MQLTEEQHQLVEAAHGWPVDVRDPQTDRVYVLLPVELYQRVRNLVETNGPLQSTATAPASSEPPQRPSISEVKPLRVVVRQLPTPPEVAERVSKRKKEMGWLWPRKCAQQYEDALKIGYYYGGQCVAVLYTKEGPVIVAAGRRDSDEFDAQLAHLSPEERSNAARDWPRPWNDPDHLI
jgi:hypothetical protein